MLDRRTALDFRQWGVDNRQWSASTRRAYSYQVGACHRWVRHNRDKTIRRAHHDDLMAWLSTLPANAHTRNVARNALRAFYVFLRDGNPRQHNPAADLPRWKVPRSVPRALDREDAAKVYVEARSEGPMWWCFAGLLLLGSLRISEARLTQWPDWDGQWMTVTGKGGHTRMVALHPDVVRALTLWRSACPDPTWIFPSPRHQGRPFSDVYGRRRVKEFGQRVGISLTPHQLRHSGATRMLETGADLPTVAEQLGHASVQTTSIYTKVRPVRVREAVDRLDFD